MRRFRAWSHSSRSSSETELVVLAGQDRLGRVDQGVHLAGGLFVVLGGRRATNGLGEYLIEREFDVGVVHDVVVLDDDDLGHDVLVLYFFDVVNIDHVLHFHVYDILDVDILDVVEVLFTDDLFVEAVGELFLVEYLFCIAVTGHKSLFYSAGIVEPFGPEVTAIGINNA